jgi:RNA polymerase sigma-70 factor (ECF subfamily)
MTMTLPNDLTDIELLRQVRAGTAAAFQALYRRHQGPLFRFAVMRCGSRDTAADVVQDVFMALLADKLQFDAGRGQFSHFLFGVARNMLLKIEAPRWRTDSLFSIDEDGDDDSVPELGSNDAEPLARMLANELAEEVRQALALLPPHYRDALILYELHDLSYLEIAAICQVDVGTVRSRLSRGRTALAKRLSTRRPELTNAA